MVPVSRATAVAFLVASVFMGAGCLPEAPTTPQSPESQAPSSQSLAPDPQKAAALFSEWRDLAGEIQGESDNPRPFSITAELAAKGPAALNPMIAYLGDPDASDRGKLLVVRCLSNFVSPDHIEAIHRVFREQQNETSRACAIALLGLLNTPDVVPILQAAVKDEQPRVRFAAMSGLVNNGDRTVRAQLSTLYQEEATRKYERLEILRVLLASPQPEDVPVLLLGLGMSDLDSQTRTKIAVFLGRKGDESVIESLQQSLELDSDPLFQSLCESAIEAVEERESVVRDEPS